MDIFEQVIERNAEIAESLFVEPAIAVHDGLVTGGIFIEATQMYAPLFFSSTELRAMADAADDIVANNGY